MTANFNKYIYVILMCFTSILCACGDCNQVVRGIILDKTTNLPIDSVLITVKNGEINEYSDSTGSFEARSISGGIYSCPLLGLGFTKEGYETVTGDYDNSGITKIYLEKDTTIDTSRYAVLKFNPDSDKNIFTINKDYKPANLSADEIDRIEAVISKQAKKYNKKQVAWIDSLNGKSNQKYPNAVTYYNTIEHSEKYYKQFIAVTNPKGEKIVQVNCFCDKRDIGYWKKSWVIVDDGGACFFQLEINLTTNSVIGFWVNGVA